MVLVWMEVNGAFHSTEFLQGEVTNNRCIGAILAVRLKALTFFVV